jgi:flagellar P-ring protein precursor FlgI
VSAFISSIEVLRVTPDACARVVVNERTGTVVLGGEVSISTAIVAHGNLTVRIGSTLGVSQPGPFSNGDTAIIQDTQVTVEEDPAKVILVPQTTSVEDLADVLNQLGASPRKGILLRRWRIHLNRRPAKLPVMVTSVLPTIFMLSFPLIYRRI